MFILFKFIISVSAFFVRLKKFNGFHFNFGAQKLSMKGLTYYLNIIKGKRTKTTSILSSKTSCKVLFKLNSESFIDRIFKLLGFSEEIQTNNSNFDSKVYISSDSLNFAELIKSDVNTQNIILNLFSNGCESISCDGNEFSIDFKGELGDSYDSQELFISLFQIIEKLQLTLDESKQDHFEKKLFSLKL